MTFTKENAEELGSRGGKVSRPKVLSLAEMEKEVGDLKTVADAQRWLTCVAKWTVTGRLPGAAASAANRSVELWLRAIESDHTEEMVRMRKKVKELEGRLKEKRVAY